MNLFENVNPTLLSEFINFLLAHENLTFNYHGQFVPNPHNLTYDMIVTELYEKYCIAFDTYISKKRGKGKVRRVDYHHFKRSIEPIRGRRMDQIRNEAYKLVCSDGQFDLTQLNQYVTAIVGHPDKVVVGVLAHWIANIKRKMKGLPISYQIMPVLTGKQKGGKSRAVRSLLKPLGELAHETTLSTALRPENFTLFSSYYAVFFDEMEGVQKSSISGIKKMITEDMAGGRRYYTQDIVNVKNISSFIGTSNDALLDLIDDKTGARRFFEIKCSDRINWDLINSVNYVELWNSIDDQNESKYYLEVESAIEEAQASLVSIDMFQQFIEDSHIIAEPGAPTIPITTESIYKVYSNYLEKYQTPPLFAATFFKKLLGLGAKRLKRTVTDSNGNKSSKTFYYVNPNSSMLQESIQQEKSLLSKFKRDINNMVLLEKGN